MIVNTVCSPERLRVRVWMNPGADRGLRHRHDILLLDAIPATGAFHLLAMTDLGLAVLQPQIGRPVHGNRVRELINAQAGRPERLEALAAAIAIAAYMRLTGLDGNLAGHTSSKSARDLDIVSGFESFLGRAPMAAPSTAHSNGPSQLEIPSDAVVSGIENSMLQEESGLVRPNRDFSVVFDSGPCAIEAAAAMKLEMECTGYRFPEGFQDLDLDAARNALGSVDAPAAQAVAFYADTGAPHAKWRQQSAAAYPLLAEWMAQFDLSKAAIDEAKPLQPVITELTNLNKGKLRRVAKLRAPLPKGRVFEFGEEARGEDPLGIDRTRQYALGNEVSLSQLLALFAEFDTGWVPGDEEAWTRFVAVVGGFVLPACKTFSSSTNRFLNASKGNWTTAHRQLATTYGYSAEAFDLHHVSLATSDVFEMIDDFTLSVLLPSALTELSRRGWPLPQPTAADLELARRIAFAMLTSDSGNPSALLLGCARRWLSRVPALIAADNVAAAVHEADGGSPVTSASGNRGAESTDWVNAPDWPSLTAEFRASNGLQVLNLTSEECLLEESRRLSHCVGRLYHQKARRGACHIYSVRDATEGESLSTFEVAPPASNVDVVARDTIRIVQHKAKRNRRPGSKAVEAMTDWIAVVRSGALRLNLEEVNQWRESIAADPDASGTGREIPATPPADAWVVRLGRNWQDQEVGRAVWGEWRQHILRGELARTADPCTLLSDESYRVLLDRFRAYDSGNSLQPD